MTAVELSIVSPVYGCVASLSGLLEGIEAAARRIGCEYEIVLVDDGSPDQAWQRIIELAESEPRLRALRLSRNFGQHAAISAGLEVARGDWVVVMDCDLQDPPAAIPDLLEAAKSGGHDVVFAERVDRQDPVAKRLFSWAFYRTLGWLTGVPQDGSTANFGVYNRKVIDAVLSMPERDRAFPLMVRWVGFKQSKVPVKHARRPIGRTTYSLSRMLKLALHIVLGYSDKPLRMVAWSGLASAFFAFLVAGIAIFKYFSGDITVAGYTSVMASVLLMGGLILVGLGVVGLYVGQVFANVQGRPSSIVAEVLESH